MPIGLPLECGFRCLTSQILSLGCVNNLHSPASFYGLGLILPLDCHAAPSFLVVGLSIWNYLSIEQRSACGGPVKVLQVSFSRNWAHRRRLWGGAARARAPQ